jgi:MFS family permease
MGRYLRILGQGSARWPFLAAVIARLPIAMGPLGMVVLIQHVRGAYAIAGLVTAAFALGSAVAAPLWGRLLDRRGQPWVIGPLAVVSGSFLAVLAVSAVGGAPDVVLVALAAGVGVTFPPMSPAMRAAWRVALSSDADRRAAYALDAVAVETIFVGGPLLLSLLLVVAAPVVPLLVTAALLAVGGVAYALTGAARSTLREPHPHAERHRGASPLRDGGVQRVLVAAVFVAVGFGLTDLAIAATARQVLGDQARVGMLFAAIAGGSATGGLWYGSRAWKGEEHRRLPVPLGGFAAGLAAMGALLVGGAHTLVALLPVLYLTGLCIAPGLIVLANLIDHHGPVDRLAEAQAWLNAGFTSGGAMGTAVAGAAVDVGGPALAFGVASVAVAAAFVVGLTGGRAWGVSRP